MPVRKWRSGATRDSDANKLDYEGFVSPMVLRRYAEYMHKNRVMADGGIRDSDNWQRGIPVTVYAKSLVRHVMEFWQLHRDRDRGDAIVEALCAIMFNCQGYLFELLRRGRNAKQRQRQQ